MKFSLNALPTVAAAFLASTLAGVRACQDCTNNSTDPIVQVPAPWTLYGQVYVITLCDLGLTGPLPAKAYPPLERNSLTHTNAGEFIGSLGNIQIVRYTDSPVGPYDELLLVPGFWKYEDAEGQQQENVRVSRIYVSQKHTAYNGRLNWDIPKHLARFDWTEEQNGRTTVRVYPYDTDGDSTESKPAVKPWFQTTFIPVGIGNVPFSTDLYEWLSVDTTLVQPPLPAGADDGFHGELPGTDYWAKTVPGQSTDHAILGLFEMGQGDGDVVANGTNAVGDEYYAYFWPTLTQLQVGLRMDNATITFSEATYWNFANA